MKPISQDDVVRKFASLFLDAKVERDGQVKGFARWAEKAHPVLVAKLYSLASWCEVKIRRDHRDPDECVAAGVDCFRAFIRDFRPPTEQRSGQEYSDFRFEVIRRIQDERLKPREVGEILADHARTHPHDEHAELREIQRYFEMGDTWQRW